MDNRFSPKRKLVNTMLDEVIAYLLKDCCPIIHSASDYHYRWLGWIDRMIKASFYAFDGKKGCSPDNAAYEGVFDRTIL